MERENVEYNHAVFEGLLYFASEKGSNNLPSQWEFLTSEIVGGTYEYILGREFNDTWQRFKGPLMSDLWVYRLNKSLNVVDGRRVNQLNCDLAKAIRYWTELDWKMDHGESWWDNSIRYYFLFGGIHMNSTYALTVPQVKLIEENLANLDQDTLNHTQGIGQLMKKYLEADLQYIREHYYW